MPFAVATVVKAVGSVPGKAGFKMLVRGDGATVGTVGGAGLEERVKAMALRCLAEKRGDVGRFDLAAWRPGGLDSVCGGTVEVAIEVVLPVPHLLLAGGGHVGKAIADVARTLDWRVTVVDARPEYATRERFPDVAEVAAAGPEWFAAADLAPYSHLYVLGHSWRIDTEILKQALPRFPGTVGVIGSEAKWVQMRDALRKEGVADEALERVRSPIGLPIGAQTPAEIAVAVVAEIVQAEKAR